MKNIVILGATGTGKTKIAEELAGLINGEIISADSRQVYKYLDKGTNKEGIWDVKSKLRFTGAIPQHLTDIIGPDETYSAGEFVKDSKKVIKDINKRKKIAVITGGTGLYIKALVDGLAELPEKNEDLRKKYNSMAENHGKLRLYTELSKIDPVSAEKNKSNTQRMIRALEVYEITGKAISELQNNTVKPKDNYIQFGLYLKRDILYEKLNRRCMAMIERGMIDETQKVLSMGFNKNCPGLNGLGYGHIIDHVEGKTSSAALIELFCRDTRHYAKRQETWFKRDPKINWINTGPGSFDPGKTAHAIYKMIIK